MSNLEQAKRRDKKVYITDIAINKVPYIAYRGFDKDKCIIMQELAKNVLLLSKEENDYKMAFQLFRECISELNSNSLIIEQYLAALSFLAKCSEVGLYYR